MTIERDLPNLELLLALTPGELASVILTRLAQQTTLPAHQKFNPYSVVNGLTGMNIGGQAAAYGGQRMHEVELAISEALHWLEVNQLTMPDVDSSSNGAWFRLTRRGREAAASPKAFEDFRRAIAFPKALLHPLIADKVWLSLARGDLADAVFVAFRTVEERVREAAAYTLADYGADMMTRAFHKDNGPLTKLSDPPGEREGLMRLAAGAIGSYKNPHSHRTVTISEAAEAQEMVMLACHLLRIVDSRAQKSAS